MLEHHRPPVTSKTSPQGHAPQELHLPPKFEMGAAHATPGAIAAILAAGADVFALLTRHSQGDWGDLEADDKEANNLALIEETRLFSAYNLPNEGGRVWVITEADRSATTVLLPEEY